MPASSPTLCAKQNSHISYQGTCSCHKKHKWLFPLSSFQSFRMYQPHLMSCMAGSIASRTNRIWKQHPLDLGCTDSQACPCQPFQTMFQELTGSLWDTNTLSFKLLFWVSIQYLLNAQLEQGTVSTAHPGQACTRAHQHTLSSMNFRARKRELLSLIDLVEHKRTCKSAEDLQAMLYLERRQKTWKITHTHTHTHSRI